MTPRFFPQDASSTKMTPKEFDEIKREVANLKVQVLQNQALILAVARNTGVKNVLIKWADSSNLQNLEALEDMLSQKGTPRRR